MKILKVTLENVKSYRKEEIYFNDGINVIAGRNGAGKSTLIEAIGFALFGYLNKDYNFQDFLSHGANSGSICIDFVVDGLKYRIERHFNARSTKNWVIFDYQTDETIETHTAEDVSYTLSKILGIQEDITLAELFERIIGVNQGTFTEPFLRSAGGRKEYFERIFMLDSYKTAYQKSSDAQSSLRQQLDDLEKDLIKLRTRVETYKEIKSQYKEKEFRLRETLKSLTQKQKELAILKEEIMIIKAKKERIQALENEDMKLQEQAKQLISRQSELAEEIQVGQKARELVDTYRKTHEDYLECKGQIEDLEKRLVEQEELFDDKENLEKKILITRSELKTREENLLLSKENYEKEYAKRQEEIEEYEYPLKGINSELQIVSEELQKVALDSEQLHENMQKQQNAIEYTRQLKERLDEIITLKAEIDGIEERLTQLPLLKEAVKEITPLEEALAEVTHSISAISTRIEHEEENMEKVGDGLCPLLKTECKTIEGQNLKEYFTLRLQTLEKEKKEALIIKAELTTRLNLLRKQAEQLAVLTEQEVELTKRLEKMQDFQSRSRELAESIYHSFLAIYEKLANYKKKGYLKVQGKVDFSESLPQDLHEQYSFLNTQLDIVANWLTISQNEIEAQERELLLKRDDLILRKTEFNSKIHHLQTRSLEITEELHNLTNIEKQLTAEHLDLQTEISKITDLTERLANFGDIKGELKTVRECLAELEEGNNIFLTHKQKAQELHNLLELQERLKQQSIEINQRIAEIQIEFNLEKEDFEPQVLVVKEGQGDELNRAISKDETLVAEGERRLQELKNRLSEMEKIKEQIKEREAEEARLKKANNLLSFIRNVYNTSAQEIAHVFLHYISHEATKIYRQLSGENVQLIWNNDYQVSLKDKHRIRVFRQLSGGEQMSAAFAIRLALLRKFSTVRLGFFDEPTTHLDEYRRLNIAQAIAAIREKEDNYFEQIFIISHDDTFTTLTENLIKLDKDPEQGSYLVKD